MVVENPAWGAPRIHGELLMLSFEVSERTVSRWMKRAPRDPEPATRWLTFLRNHREASVPPSLRCVMLYAVSQSFQLGRRNEQLCISAGHANQGFLRHVDRRPIDFFLIYFLKVGETIHWPWLNPSLSEYAMRCTGRNRMNR
jgi:hypothetical protein